MTPGSVVTPELIRSTWPLTRCAARPSPTKRRRSYFPCRCSTRSATSRGATPRRGGGGSSGRSAIALGWRASAADERGAQHGRGDDDRAPYRRDARLDRVRHFPVRPAALHDLLEPRVVGASGRRRSRASGRGTRCSRLGASATRRGLRAGAGAAPSRPGARRPCRGGGRGGRPGAESRRPEPCAARPSGRASRGSARPRTTRRTRLRSTAPRRRGLRPPRRYGAAAAVRSSPREQPNRRHTSAVNASATPTPHAAIAFTGLASRFPGSTTPGQKTAAESTIPATATTRAPRPSRSTSNSRTAIATIASG